MKSETRCRDDSEESKDKSSESHETAFFLLKKGGINDSHATPHNHFVFTKSSWACSQGVLSSCGDVFTFSHAPPTL